MSTGDENMFRKSSNKDVTDEEYQKYVIPEIERRDKYLIDILIPDFCAYSIAMGWKYETMPYHDYKIHLGDFLNYFNIPDINEEDLKIKISTILKEKYNLEIINEKPLDLKELSK